MKSFSTEAEINDVRILLLSYNLQNEEGILIKNVTLERMLRLIYECNQLQEPIDDKDNLTDILTNLKINSKHFWKIIYPGSK